MNALRGRGWTVTVSPYYSENFTDKPREIDIIAEKAVPIWRRRTRTPRGEDHRAAIIPAYCAELV